jgi:hypothetical protein
MEINLHVIAEDIKDFEPKMRIIEEFHIRRLRLPSLFSGQKTQLNLLYIVNAVELNDSAIEAIIENSSLIIIGKPPSKLLDKNVNLVWVDRGVDLTRLFTFVVERFSVYDHWENQIQKALIANKRLDKLAELSAPIVCRPMFLIDSYMQTIFANIDERYYELPIGYQSQVIDNNNPSIGIYTLERFQEKTLTNSEPFVLSAHKSYRTLNQNIFLESRLLGTLSFDEIGTSFSDRDLSLIVILADSIASSMTFHEEWNASVPQSMDIQIHKILSSQLVPYEDIDAALKGIAWSIDDAYCCIVAEPLNPLYPVGLLGATAKSAWSKLSQTIYTVHEHRMVFVVNTDQSGVSLETTIKLLHESLARLDVRIGVSNIFNGFRGLINHYRLAIVAQELGSQGEQKDYYCFEDYFMDYVVDACKGLRPLEAVIPRGLIQLKNYDDEHDMNLLHILRVFLKHDMRITSAARDLFLHRNTLSAKIAQIQFITRMDFENDPDVRLRTLVGLYMMES